MEFYSIEVKDFKRIFFLTIVVLVSAILASYFLVESKFVLWGDFNPRRAISTTVLLLLMLITPFYGSYRRKKLSQIHSNEDFSSAVKEYYNIYKLHLGWLLLSGIISCFLFVLTWRNFFLYFALFELLITLPAYPGRALFKRDLKNDEIVLY